VRPDLVLRMLSPGLQRWVEVFNCLVAIIFCSGMVWYGWGIVHTSLILDERSSSDLQFPIWLYYLALPTGGVLMGVRYLMRLWCYLTRFDARTMTPGRAIRAAPSDIHPPVKPG